MAAAASPAAAHWLKMGDLVVVLSQEEEEDGFVSSAGTTEDRVSLKTIKDKGS
jgi:hypothetical protein